jgi:hypothetical protein
MKKKWLKRTLVLHFVVIIGFAELVATRQVEAGGGGTAGPACDGRNCRDNSTGFVKVFCDLSKPCPAGWTEVQAKNREKQRLLRAYAAQSNPSNPDSANQPGKRTTLRSASAIGLSVFVLLAALLALAKLIHAFLARLRPPLGQTQRYAGMPLMKNWSFAAVSLVALIGVALVIGSSAGSDAASARLSGHRPPVPTGAGAPLNPQSGNFTSAIEIGGAGTTQIGGTAIDAAGNLYVTGGFTGNIVFNTMPQTTLTSTQDDDVFVAKFDSSGHPVWARMANGATGLPAGLSLDGGLAVAADSQGNSYVGGGFVKTLAFKDAIGNTLATLNSSGSMLNFELFVAKYAPNGTLLWAKGGMSGSPQHAGDLNIGANDINDIVLDGTGNPYVAGNVGGTNFLGTTVSQTGTSEMVVSRLNPATGVPVWVSVTGGVHNTEVLGLGIDAAANLYVMGDISDTTTFPTQPPTTLTDNDGFVNSFVAKFNQNGQCLWVKQIGGEDFVLGDHLAVNGAGQIYVTGEFDGSVTFGSIILNESKPGSGEDGLGGFLAKLDTDGQTWLWAREFDALGERVVLDGAGNPDISGTFFGDAVFGAENQPTSQTLTSLGDEDQYVAAYDAAGNFKFAKALPGDGESSEDIIRSGKVEVDVIPIRLVYNRLTCAMNVSGDFSGKLTLDNIMLNFGEDRHGFVAALTPACCTMQPPVITCPGSITTTAAASCPPSSGAPVNFTVTANDDCPGVTIVCRDQNNQVVTSGQSFPVGTTTVTCTATDTSGNTANCSFTVTVFGFCLQDDTNPGNVVLVNAQTGDFSFCCGGVPIASGRGALTTHGCIGSIDTTKGDRQVHIQWDTSANNGLGAGTAYVQKLSNKTICQITDKNMSNNNCQCSIAPPAGPRKPPKQRAF